MKNEIDKLVKETMQSLDHVERAIPKPFLLTRLNAALSNSTPGFWSKAVNIISRPQNAIIGLLLIVLINVLVITRVYDNAPPEAIASGEFMVSVANIYDIENPEP